jgi:plastocyanin
MPGLHASKLALLVAALCLLAGCSRTLVVSGNRTLHLALSEYQVKPQDVRVSAGELIIYVVNYGRLTHDLVISHDGQTTDSTEPLPPGQGAELALDLAPGKYLMASTIKSDQTLGAYGTLTVTR